MHPTSAKPARITCPRCAGKNPEIARFCNHCGLDLAAPFPAPSPAGAAKPAPASASALSVPAPSAPPQVSTPAPATALVHAPSPAPAAPPTTRPFSPLGAPEPAAAEANPTIRGRKICPGCHTFNAATSHFCADCGVALPKEATVPTFGGPAGFWIRLVAFIIDVVLLALIDALLSDRLGLPNPDPERLEPVPFLIEAIPSLALSLVTTSLYAMILVGTWGGTVGKLILGLRVVRYSDGGRVPYGLALGRSLAQLISGLFLLLGYLWIALTPSKRGWHDYLCDTRVVRVRPQ
ncbi:MAG: RDD family protein [Nannocystaceae bacterium]